ncbi:hypothetical protein V2A60_000136 [Cordyceps javanica]|uniref:Uncharacterized protein n=1 Tax=Cordyceps javanica TaxID=43265 RepID=A0A545W3C1_9HYPO|nr:hypothetical protein IF1G_04481 [Cordyceps javanica]TQW08482.1 hypothetical protein IF2G_04358 [Cordyceps javanica]
MPFVGGGDSPPPARSKRRWQDHDDHYGHYDHDHDARGVFTRYRPEDTRPFGGGGGDGHPFGLSARRMAAPVSKRTRLDSGHEYDGDDNDSHPHGGGGGFPPCHRRRCSQQSQKKTTQQNTSAAAAQSPPPPNAVVVAPCHICHRRPTKKTDLVDSFARCQGCGEQTCFVCIRQCHSRSDVASVLLEQEALSRSFHMEDADDDAPGDSPDDRPPKTLTLPLPLPLSSPQAQTKQKQDSMQSWAACGHRSVVCSRCCVEKGPEGEVVCLGCLFGDPSPDNMTF